MLFELERSSRRGRCREVVVMSGDEGSFLTTILGAGPLRDLLDEARLEKPSRLGGDMEVEVGLEDDEGGRNEEEEEREEVWTEDIRKR